MEFKHISVLFGESIDALNIKPNGIYADGTLGGGGHSRDVPGRKLRRGTAREHPRGKCRRADAEAAL